MDIIWFIFVKNVGDYLPGYGAGTPTFTENQNEEKKTFDRNNKNKSENLEPTGIL